MGERALQNRIIKLQEIEAQKELLEKEAEENPSGDQDGAGDEAGRRAGSRTIHDPVEDGIKQQTGWKSFKGCVAGDLSAVL